MMQDVLWDGLEHAVLLKKSHPEPLGDYQTLSQFTLSPHPKTIGSTPFATHILFLTCRTLHQTVTIDECHRLCRAGTWVKIWERRSYRSLSDLCQTETMVQMTDSGVVVYHAMGLKKHRMGYLKGTFPNTNRWSINQTFEERRAGWLSVGSNGP